MKSEIYIFLIENGFTKWYKGKTADEQEKEFDCYRRLNDIHYIFWSEKYNHFFLAVKNDMEVKGPSGVMKRWKTIMIPKVFYEIEKVKILLEVIL